jgi:hypothetical protein
MVRSANRFGGPVGLSQSFDHARNPALARVVALRLIDPSWVFAFV